MISIRHSGQEELRKESNLAKTDDSVTSSNKSLDADSLAVSVLNMTEEEPKMARAMSMNVLDMPRAGNRFQVTNILKLDYLHFIFAFKYFCKYSYFLSSVLFLIYHF